MNMSATTAIVGTVVRALPCEYHDLIKITGHLYQVGRIDLFEGQPRLWLHPWVQERRRKHRDGRIEREPAGFDPSMSTCGGDGSDFEVYALPIPPDYDGRPIVDAEATAARSEPRRYAIELNNPAGLRCLPIADPVHAPEPERHSGPVYRYTWANNEKRRQLKGRLCEIEASGKLNSVRVRFCDDDAREIVSRRALRLVTHAPAGQHEAESEHGRK